MIRDLGPQCLVLAGSASGVPDDDFFGGDVVVVTRQEFSIEAVLEGRTSEYDDRGAPMKKSVSSRDRRLASHGRRTQCMEQ